MKKIVIFNSQDVRKLLSLRDCIEILREGFSSFGNGTTILPLRNVMWLPGHKTALGMMPTFMNINNVEIFGLKALGIFPSNWGTEFPSHTGAVLLFEAKHGQLLSITDATEITGIRTAATSALATQYLAIENTKKLCILGSGNQAKKHIEAMILVRKFSKIVVWSRNFENSEKLSKELKILDINVEPIQNIEEAVRESDVICTTTSSKEPILFSEWIKPGCHINAVGACTPNARELSSNIVSESFFFWRYN